GIRDGHVTGVQTCALPIFLVSIAPRTAGTTPCCSSLVDHGRRAHSAGALAICLLIPLLVLGHPKARSGSSSAGACRSVRPARLKIGRASWRGRVEGVGCRG